MSGELSGNDSKRPLQKCEQHGLAYDPSVHAGCVVCRRSSSLPPNSVPPAPAPTAVPVATLSQRPALLETKLSRDFSRFAPWLVGLRWLVVVGLLYAAARINALGSGESDPRFSFGLGQAIGMCLGLCVPLLAVPFFRSARGLVWALMLASLLGLTYASVTAPRAAGLQAMVAHTSPDGIITLSVSSDWQEQAESDPAKLSLVSSKLGAAINAKSEAIADVPPGMTLLEYQRALQDGYRKRLGLQFDAGYPFVVAGLPARVAYFRTMKGSNELAGYLISTKSPTHFHFFAITAGDANMTQIGDRLKQRIAEAKIASP